MTSVTTRAGLILTILFASVSGYASTEEPASNATGNQDINAGKAGFEQHCLVCHQPKGTGGKHGSGAGAEKGHPNRLAPPMEMVKKHYLETYPERDVFVEKVSAWVAAPDAEAAMLSHALEKFGLMPPLVVDEASRKLIAEYIFDTVPVGQCNKGGGGKHGQQADGKGGHGKQGRGEGGCHK